METQRPMTTIEKQIAASEERAPGLSPLARLVYSSICAPDGNSKARKNLTDTQLDLLRAYLQSPDGMPTLATAQVPRTISAVEYLEVAMEHIKEVLESPETTDENKATAARAMATCAKAMTTVIGTSLVGLAELIAPKKAVEAPKPKNKPPVMVAVQVNMESPKPASIPTVVQSEPSN